MEREGNVLASPRKNEKGQEDEGEGEKMTNKEEKEKRGRRRRRREQKQDKEKRKIWRRTRRSSIKNPEVHKI